MKTALALITLSCGLIMGCQDSNNSTTSKANIDVAFDGVATDADKLAFSQFRKTMTWLKKDKIWPGFNYHNMPIYLLKHSESGKQIKGAYLLNSQAKHSDSVDIEDSGLLKVERHNNTAAVKKAHSALGSAYYTFNYKSDGQDYYLHKYQQSGASSESGEALPYLITFATHEAFHQYQGKWNYGNGIQDFFDSSSKNKKCNERYPLTELEITTQLLQAEMFKDLPNDSLTSTQAEVLLKNYVTLQHHRIINDKSNQQYVNRMGSWQERAEGTARYIGVLTQKELFKNDAKFNTPTFFANYMTSAYQDDPAAYDEMKLRETFAWGYFYGSGASATWLMKKIGYDIIKLQQSVTPYSETLKMLKAKEPTLDLTQAYIELINSNEYHAMHTKSKTRAELILAKTKMICD